jgi:hypothetical protein
MPCCVACYRCAVLAHVVALYRCRGLLQQAYWWLKVCCICRSAIFLRRKIASWYWPQLLQLHTGSGVLPVTGSLSTGKLGQSEDHLTDVCTHTELHVGVWQQAKHLESVLRRVMLTATLWPHGSHCFGCAYLLCPLFMALWVSQVVSVYTCCFEKRQYVACFWVVVGTLLLSAVLCGRE